MSGRMATAAQGPGMKQDLRYWPPQPRWDLSPAPGPDRRTTPSWLLVPCPSFKRKRIHGPRGPGGTGISGASASRNSALLGRKKGGWRRGHHKRDSNDRRNTIDGYARPGRAVLRTDGRLLVVGSRARRLIDFPAPLAIRSNAVGRDLPIPRAVAAVHMQTRWEHISTGNPRCVQAY